MFKCFFILTISGKTIIILSTFQSSCAVLIHHYSYELFKSSSATLTYVCIVLKESPTIAMLMIHSCTFLLSPTTQQPLLPSLPLLIGCIQIYLTILYKISILVKLRFQCFGPASFSQEVTQSHLRHLRNIAKSKALLSFNHLILLIHILISPTLITVTHFSRILLGPLQRISHWCRKQGC